MFYLSAVAAVLFHYLTVSEISPLGHPAAPFVALVASEAVKVLASEEMATVEA